MAAAKTKYITDMDKAKALMAEGGVPTASRPRFRSISAPATSTSRSAVLVQESLGQIGIKTTINKVPGANWRTEMNKKEMPLITNVFSGWLDYPEYFFYWCYHGKNPDLQHHELQVAGHGQADRRRARRRRDRRQGRPTPSDVEGLRRSKAFTDIPRIPLYPAVRQRRDAEEHLGLLNTGSTAGSITARW